MLMREGSVTYLYYSLQLKQTWKAGTDSVLKLSTRSCSTGSPDTFFRGILELWFLSQEFPVVPTLEWLLQSELYLTELSCKGKGKKQTLRRNHV